MATNRIVDPNQFILLASVTDWLTVYRRYVEGAPPPQQIAGARKLETARIVQLRWLTAPGLGYPTTPFRVWRRPATPVQSEKPVPFTQTNLFAFRLLVLQRPMVFVRVRLNASAAGSLLAFAGAPFASSLIATRVLNSGFNEVTVAGAAIQSLVLSSTATVQSLTGLDHNVANDPSWKLVEIVGLPVGPDWAGVLNLDQPQGLVGALGDPRAAALDRFRRGAPFYGWQPTISSGIAAPPWKLANPQSMLKVMDQSVLPPLRSMVTTRPPNQHADFQVQHTLPPIDPVHPALPADEATAKFYPLRNLVFGASTDPLASLISGYGTAFEDTDLPAVMLNDRQWLNDPTRSDWDFMVTANYRRGLDGSSPEREYAAIVFAPGVGTAPPIPANLATELDGLRAPEAIDADWRAIHRVTWDKVPDSLPFRVGSYAFARLGQAPPGPMMPLMGPRPLDDALQPISATTSAAQELTGRLAALDESYGIASAPAPNSLLYALAHQDLFGLWSGWTSANASVAEPPVQAVSLLAARLETSVAPAGTPCPGQLVLELSWDWASRSPRRLEIVGRMYGQAKLGDPPANLVPPFGLQSSLGGGPGSLLQLQFNGAATATVSAAAGLSAQLEYVSLDGKTLLNAPPLTAGPRRYRLTLSGLSLNFDQAGRIGLALWARGIEQRSPNRVGDWSAQPVVASTADPRPPVILVEHEDVLLASVADANGEHHARIDWPAAAGATGYFVYTTTETKLRADRGLGDPPKSLTLSQRLVELRDAFQNNPDRRSFTRLNAQPVSGTSMQVTLPRGSKEIHLYVVLGISAGQVESAWPAPASPGLRKRPIAYAAPQIVRPAPPDLEVTRTVDRSVSPPAFRAAIRVRTKAGAAVTRVDIFRVRVPEAAIEVNTMGPPIAQLVGTAAPFTVVPNVSTVPGETQTIGTISGLDPVEGSWRRVFYRAVAWAGDDATRGHYGSRSPPSAVREVIVPPAGPPDLSALAWQWPGGGLGDAQIDGTTQVPLEPTPLGVHRLRADVVVERQDGSTETLFRFPATSQADDQLQALPTSPPAPGAHGVWRTASGAGGTGLHLLLRRASVDDRLQVRLLLTDPLGRATERLLTVPPGSPLPAPDILSPQVTKKLNVGFIVQFATSVPAEVTPAGPYRLLVRYSAGVPWPFPQLARPPLPPLAEFELAPSPSGLHPPTVRPPLGPGQLRPQRPVYTLDLALPDIPVMAHNIDIFASSAAIPVFRRLGPQQQTLIAVGLRGDSGRVQLVIAAPDGRVANLQLDLT